MLNAETLVASYPLILPLILGIFGLLWLRRRGCKKVGFANLPGEILSEVFLHLDWESLCSVKKTCRACYYTLKSRQLWYGFVKGLQESSFRRPEERLDEYSTEELEKWVLFRLRFRALWMASAPPVFRLCSFLASTARTNTRYQSILPGGRWLLTIASGTICVVDLDARQPQPQLLFDPEKFSETGRPDGVTQCSYWIDDSKPRLSFRVGVCDRMLISVNHAWEFLRILVYQVDLEGHGSNANLVAEPVVCMRSCGTGIRSICLNADFVVEFLCRVERHGGTKVTSHFLRSYCYTMDEIEGMEIEPFTLAIGRLVKYMDFIPGNRVVAFSSQDLQIFGISPSENGVYHSVHTLYTIPMPNSLTFSRLYRSSYSTSKMVVLGNNEVKGIEIPDDNPSAIAIRKIGDHEYHWKTGSRAAVGLSAGVVVHENGTMDLLSYSWGQGSRDTFSRKSCSSGLDHFDQAMISDDLGRIVVSRDDDHTTMLDLDNGQTG